MAIRARGAVRPGPTTASGPAAVQRPPAAQTEGGKKNAAPPPPPEPLEEISDETFYFLTHAQILPKIAPNEAIWYLTFSQEAYGADVLGDESMGGK